MLGRVQSKGAKMFGLGLPHSLASLRVVVVMPDKMQRAMDDVQEEFTLRGPRELRCHVASSVPAHYDFTFQVDRLGAELNGLSEAKAKDIRRIIMVQMAAIELVNGSVIDNGQTNLRGIGSRSAQHAPYCLDKTPLHGLGKWDTAREFNLDHLQVTHGLHVVPRVPVSPDAPELG